MVSLLPLGKSHLRGKSGAEREREHGDGDDDSMWYSSVISVSHHPPLSGCIRLSGSILWPITEEEEEEGGPEEGL